VDEEDEEQEHEDEDEDKDEEITHRLYHRKLLLLSRHLDEWAQQ